MSEGMPTEFRDGTLTRVTRQEKDVERVNVFIDEAFAFGLTLDLAVEAGLRPGMRLTAAHQEELLRRERSARARAMALDYLAGQARTSMEVRRRLRRKGFEEAIVDEAVRYIEGRGYIDDASYATAYVRGRFAGRGHGPARLREELLRRGVDRTIIDEALMELEADEDLGEAAVTVGRPRWRALSGESDPRRRRQKTLEFLVRRGFAFDDARAAVEQIARDEGDDDSGDFDGGGA
jgi:regulatory protein